LSTSPTTHARDLTPGAILAPTEPASPTDDGGTAEIGVEWMTDWPGTVNDRANWYYSGTDLYNKMRAAGWIGRFNWGETNAWEKDFKRAALGGIENTVGDSVDLAMIATHGSTAWDSTWNRVLTSVTFTSDKDDRDLSPGDAYRALGDNDLEWLFFDSCSVLRDDSMWYWYQTFDGLHLLGGFANTMYVVYRGDGGAFADELLKTGWWIFGHPAKTVTQAWFTATDDEQPHGVIARVLAETLDSYNDYVWGQGYVSPDYPNDGTGYYWDHVAGTPDPLPLIGEAPTHLPAVQVVQRDVNEDYVKNIGLAFGLAGDVLKSPDGRFFYMAGGPGDALQLRVDIPSGGFLFQNLDELWTDPERPRDLPPETRTARVVAQDFLEANDNLPGAFFYNRQILPTSVAEGPADLLLPAVAPVSDPLSSTDVMTTTNYAVHYARTVLGPEGEYTVVGPGSRQNIYIGDGSEVAGMKGGWRELDVTGDMIPILDEVQAWNAFLADPTIAVADLPNFDTFNRVGKPAPTLGYYEVALSQHQSQLIPVWIFVADLLVGVETPPTPGTAAPIVQDVLAADAFIYVPAADDTPVPTVTIHTPAEGTTLPYGGTVTLSGTATGGTPPYTYLWSSSYDGDLGEGATINNVALHALFHGGLAPNTITLTVVDDNGMTAATSIQLFVDGPLFLPYLNRD
jgi:hypothetical protein